MWVRQGNQVSKWPLLAQDIILPATEHHLWLISSDTATRVISLFRNAVVHLHNSSIPFDLSVLDLNNSLKHIVNNPSDSPWLMSSIYWVSHIFLPNYQVFKTDTFLWDHPGVKHELTGHLDGVTRENKSGRGQAERKRDMPTTSLPCIIVIITWN